MLLFVSLRMKISSWKTQALSMTGEGWSSSVSSTTLTVASERWLDLIVLTLSWSPDDDGSVTRVSCLCFSQTFLPPDPDQSEISIQYIDQSQLSLYLLCWCWTLCSDPPCQHTPASGARTPACWTRSSLQLTLSTWSWYSSWWSWYSSWCSWYSS